MERVACRMRCSFSTKANRTKPSPMGPKPIPGETATCAFSSSSLANSREPAARNVSARRPKEHRAARLLYRPARAFSPLTSTSRRC